MVVCRVGPANGAHRDDDWEVAMDRFTLACLVAGLLLGAGACGTDSRTGSAEDAGVVMDALTDATDDSDGGAQDVSFADGRDVATGPPGCPGTQQPSEPVRCGGQPCPPPSKMQSSPCFVPCCLQFEGQETCGLLGTMPGFITDCTLPAMPDPTCQEVPQFEGCCVLTQHKCGIIGGFAPGCQTTSQYVTLPKVPNSCGLDGGAAMDGGAGTDGGAQTDGDAGANVDGDGEGE
jgi:hypothetical protein